MKHTNCRNCKFAEWPRSKSGRREFYGPARCTFVIQIPLMPASLLKSFSGETVLNNLRNPYRQVAERADVPLDCATWEPNRDLIKTAG